MKTLRYTAALLALLTAGCTDYLSEVQDNRTTIDSKEKVRQLLVSAYVNATYAAFTEVMSDNVSDKGPAAQGHESELIEDAYKWEDIEVSDLDTPDLYWAQSYHAIAHANQALASMEALGGGEAFHPLRGEALVARAYAFFMLVNIFSRRYDPATAGTSLGIPIPTTPEKTALPTYKRATIAQVYDQIESDLTEGLPLLSDQYEEPKYHFTPAAAHAFAARFYLYKGEWEKVVEHANQVLGTEDPALLMRDFTTEEYHSLSEIEQEILYSNTLERANLLINWVYSVYSRYYSWIRYGPSKEQKAWLFDYWGLNNPFKKPWSYAIYWTTDDLHNKTPKYHEFYRVTRASGSETTGEPYIGVVLFTTEEMLLNRAEAYAMLNQWENAIQDVTAFLSKRTGGRPGEVMFSLFDPDTDKLTLALMRRFYHTPPNEYTPFYPLSFDQAVFVNGIAEFRQREFLHEGMRWFDIKRFNLEVKHPVHEADTLVLPKNDPRRAVQIPESAQAYGIKPNPR